MNKNEIFEMAQGLKDERETAITISGHKFAGTVSVLFSCVLAVIVIIDGYFIKINRSYDFVTVAFMLLGVGTLNNAVFACYEIVRLKKYSRIVDACLFGILTIGALVRIVMFYSL